MLERRGKVIATVVPGRGTESITPHLVTKVTAESIVYTDEGLLQSAHAHGIQAQPR